MVKITYVNCYRFCILLIAILVLSNIALAQRPVVSEINKSSSTVGDILTIKGSGFSTNALNNRVTFGAAQGSIVYSSPNLLEVRVPAGTTHQGVRVSNLQSGLAGFSSSLFFLAYQGGDFDPTAFSEEVSFPAESGMYDLCLCDFDGDGKIDAAASNNNSTAITLYRNTSSFEEVSFARNDVRINLNTPSINLTCSDLDGDGRPDLIISRGGDTGDRVFVMRNVSSVGNLNFSAPRSLVINGRNVRRVSVNDIDGDGRPDVVVSNESDNQINIFINTSTPGNLSFRNTPEVITVQGAENTTGLDVKDLNNDGFPEIVVNTFFDEDIFVFRNRSNPGEVAFDNQVRIAVPGELVNLTIGDFDGDGIPDIAATKLISGQVALIKNLSTVQGGDLSFGNPVNFSVTNRPWGIDVGDFNGDGKPDLAIASIDDNSNNITLLLNESSEGEFAFERNDITTQGNTRNLKVGDINGDGIPDLAYTNIDDFSMGVRLNQNCMKPEISPSGSTTVCEGSDFSLKATKGKGIQYNWEYAASDDDDFETISEGESAELAIELEGRYRVRTLGAFCEEVSNEVAITIIEGTLPETPTISNTGPGCIGESLQLTAETVSGANYQWRGPNNFESNEQNPEIENFQTENAGRYFLTISIGDCQSEEVSMVVESINLPIISINTESRIEAFCEGLDVFLRVPNFPGFTYAWERNGQEVPNQSSPILRVSQGGDYRAFIINASGCRRESPLFNLQGVVAPEVSIDVPETACEDNTVNFTSSISVREGQEEFEVEYFWDFGDGTTSEEANPSHTFQEQGNYVVRFRAGIAGLSNCQNTTESSINVGAPPEFEILSPEGTEKCENDSIPLEVDIEFESIIWSTGETSPVIQVLEAGVYTVDIRQANGCESSASIEIFNIEAGVVSIEAEELEIDQGESVQLSLIGMTEVIWSPAELLDNPEALNPIATPEVTTTFFAEGLDDNGCPVNAEITITVIPDRTLIPARAFSPNGDGINDEWIVENADRQPDCGVKVYDRNGRMVYHAAPYQNDWDGMFNGQLLPEGVYFYVFQCQESQFNRSGNVLLVR